MTQRTPHRSLRPISQATLFAFVLTSLPLPALAGGNGQPLTDAQRRQISEAQRTRGMVPVARVAAAAPSATNTNTSTGTNTGTDTSTSTDTATATETDPKRQTSSTPLCDPGSEQHPGGYGAMIHRWPDPAPNDKGEPSAEYKQTANRYVQDRNKVVFEDNVKIHKKHSGWGVAQPVVATAPNLTRSVQAIAKYHEISFGNNAATIWICEAKRQMSKQVAEFDSAKQSAAALSGDAVNACEGANKKMFETYQAAQKAYERLEKEIKNRLNGYVVPAGPAKGTRVPGLERVFFWARLENYQVNESNRKKIETIARPDLEKLKHEYETLWGKGSYLTRPLTDKKVETGGYFSDLLLQTRAEKEEAEKKKKWFSDNKEEFQKQQERCDSLTEPVQGRPGRTPPPGPTGTPPPGDEGATPPPADNGRTPPPGDDGATPPPGRTPPPGDGTPPPDDGTGGSRRPPKKEGMSGFLKDNWMWLAGGAALVGGGAYLINRHQQKKRDKENAEEFGAYLDSSMAKSTYTYTSTNTYSSSPGSGSVPAGSKLMIKNAIGNVAQGATMPAIEVFVVDSNGVPVQVDNVAIEVSCYVPQPCSLTGGKSVTTIAGAATFDSLVFNQAHTGVRLQFSAPGVPAVTMPNTIDVTPTDVRRMETRDEINGTGGIAPPPSFTSTSTSTATRE